MALYFIGADKEVLQGEIVSAGAVPAAVKLCGSGNSEVQAEAADLLKVCTIHWQLCHALQRLLIGAVQVMLPCWIQAWRAFSWITCVLLLVLRHCAFAAMNLIVHCILC